MALSLGELPKWVQTHKGPAAGGAAVAVGGGIALYQKRKGGSGSASSGGAASQAGAGAADAFNQRALRDQLQFDFLVAVGAAEGRRAFGQRVGANQLAHAACGDQQGHAFAVEAGVVGYDHQVAHALLQHGLEQAGRQARAAQCADRRRARPARAEGGAVEVVPVDRQVANTRLSKKSLDFRPRTT